MKVTLFAGKAWCSIRVPFHKGLGVSNALSCQTNKTVNSDKTGADVINSEWLEVASSSLHCFSFNLF